MNFRVENSVNQPVILPKNWGVELYVKREDKIHPFVSGNKYRKLKYNLLEAQSRGCDTLLTFGGAFSNHIAAVAYAGKVFGFKTIGIIRGEELKGKVNDNETLSFAKFNGMQFEFISRDLYRNKTSAGFQKHLNEFFGNFYLVPEGGTNYLAVKGCEEILSKADKEFDYVCSAVGTGGTISGLINCSKPSQQVLGFPALKGSFLKEDISKFVTKTNWNLITDYHFGGYAKINEELITFINKFKADNAISLDPIYTGKMLFGIYDLIKKGFFKKGTKILAIHTGGLQGVGGMNSVLKKKGLPIIE
ncbi:1-aminocyclopropane-1-carboxylate deaminase/D-cysteine desulfhydrase [Seonamhaeicola sediminis]|uniref:1-aminocyclopropane-1-carboxylate deaminase/D-cysteine desulfhydrase n=1 Tax=Seonamhaeicola sediminis TaxID=2528206 RepID=A0A562YI71_9FLAO|nr:pyridoxal-phosphate dependent enzyme [Seonamhaeicola sediminis]TWO34458.1 1-aminocyclopropane-1-carboxylate deaminase/D-cysteine desulfhydrase [Seonamhaeicola sediminis]